MLTQPSDLAPDRDHLRAALIAIRPSGTILLVVIDPLKVKPTTGRTFAMPAQLDAAIAWAEERNRSGLNCYFTPNAATGVLHKKAGKSDMTEGAYMWADCDPSPLAHGGYERAREHILRVAVPTLTAVCSIVIDSGHGAQGLLRLANPVNLARPELREHYESINQRVGALYDGPSTFNCDRVLRLPGTLNYPNAEKLAKGYPVEPIMARLLHTDAKSYTLGAIESLLLRRRLDLHLLTHPNVKARYEGDTTGLNDVSGSGRDMSMTRMLKEGGFALPEIIELLTGWDYGSQQGRDQGIRYWQRMWDKPTLDGEVPPFERKEFKQAAPEDQRTPRLRPMSVGELLAQPSPGWLVRGILPKQGLGVIYGQPGSGKSFLTLDLSGALTRGVPWFGSRVTKSNVIYLAGEGHLRNRLAAYLAQHGLSPDDLGALRILQTTINLRDKTGDLLPLLRELQETAAEIGPVALVVIDTLNAAMGGGDENESTDMGAMIDAGRRIMGALNCSALYVHHSGKDETRGARGHSSLRGAVDAEICVTNIDGVRGFTLTKIKEGEDGKEYAFGLQTIDLGPSTDPDAEPDERETSCTIIPLTDAPTQRPTKQPKTRGRPPSGGAEIALDCLRSVVHDHGQPLPSTSVIPPGKRGVRVELWRDRFFMTDAACSDPGLSMDGKRKRFSRAHDELYSAQKVGLGAGFAWLESDKK